MKSFISTRFLLLLAETRLICERRITCIKVQILARLLSRFDKHMQYKLSFL